MLQRKQSLFLLLAVIFNIVCLMMPVGELVPDGLGVNSVIYNLWIKDGNGAASFVSAPLFAILLIETVLSVFTIFRYNNRKQQIKMCSWNMLLLVVWYLAYVAVYMTNKEAGESLKLCFSFILPLVSLILTYMARRGVKADEALIRAAERIR